MIHIEPKIFEQLSQDALRTFPDECCGFLLGFETERNRFIKEIIVVDNAAGENKPRRFEISPTDYLKAERYADEKGLTLLGIYHSHPNHPSIPSEHDRKAAQHFFSYLIISVSEREINGMQSWILNKKNEFEEEELFQNKELTNFKIKNLWLQ